MDKAARQEELKRRFAPVKPLAPPVPAAPPVPQTHAPVEKTAPAIEIPTPVALKPAPKALARRCDYKGERRRLNLRLPDPLAQDLAVLCLASGVDKNAFCEQVLSSAIENQLEQVRQRYKPEEWEGILRCVREGKGF
ncbi:hypothetical protein KKP04_11270 [Rhodomicrobium sp. Az07]|uniref:hypothetical protein n=1 Tax=Rhodomicrobium sp. Az07 TaxID=2839034 RepID=UPI001BE7C252|nr:hypothetical protein [Rhodomicrobium sp. Az07]MBT3071444.1 hypothetical protein [Rhodomicrobium sp. Az07]